MNSRNRNINLKLNAFSQENYYQFKVVLLGMSGVGKTALLTRFKENKFYLTPREATIGAAFHAHKMILDGNTVKLEIWDTAGLERFRSLLPMYYRGAHAALVVYDIQNQQSFQFANELIEKLKQEIVPNIVIALVGNQLDQMDLRTVCSRDAARYARENGLLFMETSARDAINVNEIFLAVSRELFNVRDQIQRSPVGTLRLTDRTDVPLSRFNKCVLQFTSTFRKKS